MELLERFAAGDLDAFEVLFRRHQKQVYAWIVRIVRDPGIAEDGTVETFWRIYRSHARFDPAGNFAAWSYRIATNVALDQLRKTRFETELPEDLVATSQTIADAANISVGLVKVRVFRAVRMLRKKLSGLNLNVSAKR